jgi:hypothetical protein
VSKAYAQPPSSTAQILHPEKFFSQPREEPIAIEWAETAINGDKPIVDNVLGEFGIRILFSEWIDAASAERAAAGWRGDRYLCFANGATLVWKSVWANEAEANEYMEAEKETLAKRYQALPTPRVIRWLSQRNAVVLIDASDEHWARLLEEQFGK